MRRTKPELVSPAGSPEKFRAAFLYGADAVYIGARNYSLRERAENFSFNELKDARRLADKLGKKIYLALNIYFYDSDLSELRKFLRQIRNSGLDTLIISDTGLLHILAEEFPRFHIHLSTQANTTNSEAVRFYAKQGVERVILARELTLANIRQIRKAVPHIELETFVHGSMCMAYSGRCLLSHYFTGRSGNQGDCSQPCRWEYTLTEKKRDNEELEIISSERGTTILSSMDMNLIDHVPKLAQAGINAFKIEGRMKSEYYTAATTKTYRMAIDHWSQGKKFPADYKKELDTFSHRPYFTGFYFKQPHLEQRSVVPEEHYVRNTVFLGLTGKKMKNGLIKVLMKNPIRKTDAVEIFPPSSDIRPFRIPGLKLFKRTEEGLKETEVLHITDKGYIKTDLEIQEGSIIRAR
jgi:U32 family peptidase